MSESIRNAAEDIIGTIQGGPAAPTPSTPGIYLYALTGFRGASAHITSSVPDLTALNFNNRVSSWRVIGDFSATGFVGKNYTGERHTLWSGGAAEDVRQRWNGISNILVDDGLVNNTMSSVGVGLGNQNAFDHSFYWPKGAWVSSFGTSVPTQSWDFQPDHTYSRNTTDPNGVLTHTVVGSWYTPEILGQPSTIYTRHNKLHQGGGVIEVADEDLLYNWRDPVTKRELNVLIGGGWTTYTLNLY